MQAKGYNSSLILDFESTFGVTPATPAAKILPINKSSIKSKQTLNKAATLTGRRDPVKPFAGNIDVSGDIEMPLDAEAIGYILKAAFGVPVTTGSGPYTHVFKVGNHQPSLTLEQRFSDINVYSLYNGCKISKLSLTVGGDGELIAKASVMGAKETVNTVSFDPAATPIVLNRFGNFQASLQEGGTNIAIATEVSQEMDFGLDGNSYCIGGQGFRSNIAEGLLGLSGSVKALFEDTTLLNKAINGTETGLKITFTNTPYSLEFEYPELVFERNTPGIEGPAGIVLEMPFQAYYGNDAKNSSVIVTLVNDVASY